MLAVNTLPHAEKLTCHPLGVVGTGPLDAEVMLVGIAPGRNEMATGRPMTGQSGILTNNILEATGWHRDKCFCTNLCCYQIEEPTLEQIMACRPRFLRELELVKPKLIVTLGAVAASMFFSDKTFGKVQGMIDWHPQYNAWVLPTYHPAAILRSGDMGPTIATDIVNDFKKIAMFFADGDEKRDRIRAVKYEIVTSPTRLQEVVNELPVDRPVILDVETDNKEIDELDPQDDRLICLGISYVDNSGIDGPTWVAPQEHARGIDWRTSEIQWGAHYFAFDSQTMMRIGVDIPITHDSLLAHFTLDERSGKHKAKPLARGYCYSGFYEEEVEEARKGRKGKSMGEVAVDATLEYNAKDTAYEARMLSIRFIPQMIEEGVYGLYSNLLIPAANAYKYMQWRGAPISRYRLRGLAEEWLPLYVEKTKALQEKVHSLGGPEKINLDSPKQLSRFLYGVLRLPGGPSTAKDVIEQLAGEHPFVTDLISVRHLGKMIGTYLEGINDDIKADGRVHPAPLLHGTVGGRCSYSRPSVNTIPRPYEETSPYGYKLRQLFVAAPDDDPERDDWIIVEADYRQAEIYMAQFYCQDPTMLADLQSGDFHTNTAAFITELPLAQIRKAQRSDAKKTTFGQFFGIGDDKLSKQIKKPVTEATKLRKRWQERYPRYVEYTERSFKHAQEEGWVGTITGRRRRFPIMMDASVRNQIINFPIQATAHDCLMSSIIELYPTLYADFGAEIMLDVHDAMIVRAKKSNYLRVAARMKEVMERPRFSGLPSIPVEIKAGPSWAETYEVDI